MEFQRNWSPEEIAENEHFIKLGEREQQAIGIVLDGIKEWEKTGVAPKPMIVSTVNHSFNLVDFEEMLHSIGVGIRPLIPHQDFMTYTFQPVPFLSEKIDPSVRKRVLDFIQQDPNISEEVRDSFNRFR